MRIVGPYAELLRLPGAAQFSAAAFIARLPISMVGLGIVLMVSALRNSYAEAGVVAAAYTVSAAVLSPVSSRAVDRWGQLRVVRILVFAHAIALVLLAVAATLAWAFAILIALAVIAGSTQPSTGALVRARWASLLAADHRVSTAFAFEGLLDELIFVLGPPLATVLAVTVGAPAPVVVAAALVSVGSAWLLSQRRTEPEPIVDIPHADTRPVRRMGMPVVLMALLAIGGVFGSIDIAVVAAADAAGARAAAGALLAAYAAGSMVAALFFGSSRARVLRENLPRTLAGASALLALVTLPLAFVSGLWLLGLMVLVAGLAVSPVLISCFTLVEKLVPARQITEGLAWAISAIGLGVAAGAAGTGWWVDRWGSQSAWWITSGVAVALAATGLIGHSWLRRGVSAASEDTVD